MRVLVADDQRSFGTALADMVRWCGHDVVAIVGSGFEAIQAYSRHKPDLVLMDYRMPKLNGATASRHILAKNPTARIILVSAWSPEDGADQSGAMSFLPKPVELERLSITLHNISQTLPPSAPAKEHNNNPQSNNEPAQINFPPETINYFPEPVVPPPPPPVEMIFPADIAPLDIFPPTESAFAPATPKGFASPDRFGVVDPIPKRNGGKQRRRTQPARVR